VFGQLREAYRFRFVIYNYVYSSLKQKYRRSVLGFLWSVVTPLLYNLVVGVVFSKLMRIQMEHYLVFLFSGSVVFNLLTAVTAYAPGIMTNNEHFIKKIYVPKLVFVLQVVLLELVNFVLVAISLIILGIAFSQLSFSATYFYLLVPLAIYIVLLVGIGSLVGIAAVYFRDIAHILPVVIQALFFLTPIMYPLDLVPEHLRGYFLYNPMYYLIEIFRVPILQHRLPSLAYVGYSAAGAAAVFLAGLYVLQKYNHKITFKL
jgi:ABC-2 type transport system permease protein/lipopolysaccharide transport system permease protein